MGAEDFNEGMSYEREIILELIDKILDNRRRQVNIAFEGKDERMMAHLHTFINKFEEELKFMLEEQTE